MEETLIRLKNPSLSEREKELLQSAVVSAFSRQVNLSYLDPNANLQVQLLEIYRRSLLRSVKNIVSALTEGVIVNINGQLFVTEFVDGDRVNERAKKFQRVLHIYTKSPKTSQATIFRRNSSVIEKRVPVRDWRSTQRAKEEKQLRQRVALIPYKVWQEKQRKRKNEERNRLKLEIDRRRGLKAGNTGTEVKSSGQMLIDLINSVSERNGVVNPKEMASRINVNLNNGTPQPIIFIWGPPYEGQGQRGDSFSTDKPEKEMLDLILNFFKKAKETGVNILPILIYADTYGAEINGIPEDEVHEYYNEICEKLPKGIVAIPVSKLMSENSSRHEDFVKSLTSKKLDNPNRGEIQSARKIQVKLGRNPSSQEIEELARQYRLLRFIEGEMLTEGFHYGGVYYRNVIKLATAPDKRNDDPYEPRLPRFYIKGMPRAPWNKPR